MRVRDARATDIPWMLEELKTFSEFYGSRHPLFPEERTSRILLEELIVHELIWVAEERDEPRGFLVASLTPHPYNPELRMLSCLLWWVRPEARGGRAARALFDAFQAYGRAHAQWIVMTITKDTPINPSSLEKRGFVPREVSYLLEVTP